MLDNNLHKHVVVCGYLHSASVATLSNRIAKARQGSDSFAFLEWAEPFVVDYNRIQKLADVRLMHSEELSEFMPVDGRMPVVL